MIVGKQFLISIGFIIGTAILVHGYLFIRYGTADQCAAAVARLTEQRRILGMHTMPQFIEELRSGRKAETIAKCYAIALLGPFRED